LGIIFSALRQAGRGTSFFYTARVDINVYALRQVRGSTPLPLYPSTPPIHPLDQYK